MTNEILAKRYQLFEQLGMGGMGTVFAAVDRLRFERVAVKRLIISDYVIDRMSQSIWNATHNYRTALAREFQTLATLRHPNIVSVIDYGFDSFKQPFFTMELLSGASDMLIAAQRCSLDEKLDLIGQLLRAIAYLHRRDILHRDIKPDNVLVIDNEVRVLDFGLAVSRELSSMGNDVYSGTLTHMAPELLIGRSATVASDLYAIGVIAYQILAGKHPFEYETLDLLAFKDLVQQKKPDMSEVTAPEKVVTIVERLLEKEPEKRYAYAHEVLEALSQATPVPIVIETHRTRESYIQAAEFVGRQNELQSLLTAFQDARQGQGSSWLIGGESGVGKSRLLSEFRIQTAVSDALILEGQVDQINPYGLQPWQSILRHLILAANPDDVEAAILESVVHDIGELLHREISPATPVKDMNRARSRLFATITALLKRLESPCVILIEDLQWANEESLALMEWLCRAVTSIPVMIVGTFRTDEVPQLPDRLYQMQTIVLQRLNTSEIVHLSESMLGKRSVDQEVLDLLQAESEGNAFFIVEVMRALGDEVAHLDKISRHTLPESIFIGGIGSVLRRRFEQFEQDDQRLLTFAAVNGRMLDLEITKAYAGDFHIEAWLMRCSERAVLEVIQGDWRFTHDRMRNEIINLLPDEDLNALHGRVAETIEIVHESRITEFAGALARHWDSAGNTAKTLQYSLIAGREAARTYANEEALNYLKRAHELSTKGRQQIGFEIATIMERLGEFGEAEAILRDMLADPITDEADHLALMRCFTLLGQLLTKYVGAYDEGIQYLEQALSEFDKLEDLAGSIETYTGLAVAYWSLGQFDRAFEYLEKQLSIARKTENFTGISSALRIMGNIYTQRDEVEKAESVLKEALQIAQSADDIAEMANTLNSLGVLYTNQKRINDAFACLTLQLQKYKQIGDVAALSDTINSLGTLYASVGAYDQSLQCLRFGVVTSTQLGEWLSASIGLIYQVETLRSLEQFELAKPAAEWAVAIVRKLKRQYHLAGYLVYGASIFYETGDYKTALAWAREALEIAQQIGSPSFEFEANIQRLRTMYAINDLNLTSYIEELEKLIVQSNMPERIAEVRYQIWLANDLQQEAGAEAARLYLTLYESTRHLDYRKRYEEITKRQLDLPMAEIPPVPDLVKEIPLDLEAAMELLDLWLKANN